MECNTSRKVRISSILTSRGKDLFSADHGNLPSTSWNEGSLPPMPIKQVVLNRFINFSSLIPSLALLPPFPHPVNIQTLPFIPDFPPTSLLCLYTPYNIMAWHGPLIDSPSRYQLLLRGSPVRSSVYPQPYSPSLTLTHFLTQSLQFIPVFFYILSSPMHPKTQCHLLPFSYMFHPQPHPIPQLTTMPFLYVIHNFFCAASLHGLQ